MSYTLYGIPNCDTVKKAKTWLTQNNIEFTFHNFKTDGLTEDTVNRWLNSVGQKTIVNKASSTFRKLGDEQKLRLENGKDVAQLVCAHASIVKRPVLEKNNEVVAVGFKPDNYRSIFS